MADLPAPLTPTAPAERIGALDTLRGLALLGILVANIEWFNRSWLEVPTAMPAGLSGLDHGVAWLVYVFVLGKFITLFSLLFGMGFALMHERARAGGRAFVPVHLRRTALLLGFGLAHALLLWVGDILQTYALAALLMVPCRNWKPRTQLRVGLGIWGAGALAMAAAIAFAPTPDPALVAARTAETQALIAQGAQVYAHGGYAEVTAQRLRDLRWYWGLLGIGTVITWSLFLIGAWLARSGRLRDPVAHAVFWRRLAAIGVPAGLALSLASASWFGIHTPLARTIAGPDWGFLLHILGSLPLTLGYMALTMLWIVRSLRPLRLLAPVGRMALTNYLAQSLVCSLLFFGYGLALWGQVRYAGLITIALALYALQVGFSHWWMRRFRFGPMEWLWRTLTYLKPQPMRRTRALPAAANPAPPG